MLEQLGAGRFGPVYRAQDASGAMVAVKVFDQGLTPEQGFAVAASLKELCRAPLDHPSIVPLVAAGLEGDRLWAAEPWVDAAPLDHVMRRTGAQPLRDVLVRITQIGAALDFAAAAGIHHGALHPRDILLTADRTALTGLGVLQALGEAGLEVPMEGAYVSPQRARGLPIAARDDIFTLAAITYELVYGTTVPERALLRMQMTPLAGVDHARFADVIEGALSSDPIDRPSTALEFVAALQNAVIPIPIQNSDYGILDSNSDSDSSIPIPRQHPAEDLPLRSVVAESELRNPNPNSESQFHSRHSESESEFGYWFGLTAALAIGLLTGFAGGFVAGQRDETPTPHRAERAVARAQRPAPSDEKSAPTAGRDFTESAVPPSQSAPVTQAEPLRPPERTEPTERQERTEQEPSERFDPSERGSIQVDSRPRGARVFVDGRMAGTTPLLVADVASGSHAVRIDLSGYERWVTAVTVAPGTRQRVAASLTLIGER